MEKEKIICPKCKNEENFHFNYDYSKKEMPVEEVLCNECGEFFKLERVISVVDVKNNIKERIKIHEKYIAESIELIQTEKRPVDVICTLTEEIKRLQIRISELNSVLENCF